jgi:hypothetical protein
MQVRFINDGKSYLGYLRHYMTAYKEQIPGAVIEGGEGRLLWIPLHNIQSLFPVPIIRERA